MGKVFGTTVFVEGAVERVLMQASLLRSDCRGKAGAGKA